MPSIQITKGRYPQIFGGLGFNNIEALMYPAIEKEHFDQFLCKCYREVAPGFMRTFAGYADQTKQSMDAFAEYYERMQKVTDTPIFLTTTRAKVNYSEEEMAEYCEKVADKLAYMKQEKGIRHLRYYCFSGEMSEGDWGALMNDELPMLMLLTEDSVIDTIVINFEGPLNEQTLSVFMIQSALIGGTLLLDGSASARDAFAQAYTELETAFLQFMQSDVETVALWGMDAHFGYSPIDSTNYDFLLVLTFGEE